MVDHAEVPQRVEAHVVIVMGATGDLARRSLFPALYRLYAAGLLPEQWRIIGAGRREVAVAEFRERIAAAVGEAIDEPDSDTVAVFVRALDYVVAAADDIDALATAVAQAEGRFDQPARRLIYLSLPTAVMPAMVEAFERGGLVERTRLVIEKPFGHDAASARELFEKIGSVFAEDDIYRIDHFLGLRSLHNLLALRSANALPEALWNSEYIESVQIDVPENIDVEGRGSFMESTGTFADMISSHLLQTLGMIAMDVPDRFDHDALSAGRRAVFDDLRPIDPDEVVFGQYRGYRDRDDVAEDSDTETFVALRAWVDSDRWSGVPFLLRTGKALAADSWTLTVRFRDPEPSPFGELPAEGNELVVALDATAGVTFALRAIGAGPSWRLGAVQAHDTGGTEAAGEGMDPYQRLLHDVLRADRSLFVSVEEAVRLWEVCAAVLTQPPQTQLYERGTWGPRAATELAGPRGWQVHR